MKKKRVFLYVLLGIGFLAAVAVVLNLSFGRSRFDTATPVRSYQVARGALEDVVTGNGSFKPRTSVSVVAQVSGEVLAVRAREGDRVQAGALLVQIRDDEYRLTAQKMKSALESARRGISQSLVTLRAQYRSTLSALEDAKRTFEKNRELFASKAIAEEIYQRSEDAYKNAALSFQSAREQLNLRCALPLDADPPLTPEKDSEIIESSPEVAQALLSLQSAQDSLAKCRITTPVSGTVTQLKLSVGDFVAALSPIGRVETLDDMLAEIQIDEVDIGKIQSGQKAQVTSDSIIGKTLQARVFSIAPTVTTLGSSRISLVELQIENAGQALKAGASCSARIIASIKQDALLIPLSSFFTEENLSYVYAFKPIPHKTSSGAAVFQLEKREMRTGTSNVNFVEALSGLTEGDRIAAGNLKLLRDGIYVTLKEGQ